MARKSNGGDVNKSQLIREMFAKNPEIKVKEIVAQLGEKGIVVQPNLVYLIKGKLEGGKKRRRRRMKRTATATTVATASGSGDALATVMKVKKLAADVGGLRVLKALVEALSE